MDNKFFLSEIISNAKVNNEFPASTAVASPNFLCVDNFLFLLSRYPCKEDHHELKNKNEYILLQHRYK